MPNLPPPQAPRIRNVQGPHFTYALPEGWRVVEEGNYAINMVAPEGDAGILVYGLSGLMFAPTPEQFVQSQMPGLFQRVGAQLLGLQIMASQPIQPLPGYMAAAALQLGYAWQTPQETRQVRAVALCNVAATEGTMTLASSKADLWEARKDWLPAVAACAVNTGPNPYGRVQAASIMRNNEVRDSIAFQTYNDWSQQNWAGVQAARDASFAYQQRTDTSLTGQQWYSNPFGYDQQRLSAGLTHWMHRDGRVVSLDDPAADPNTPTDPNWSRMAPR